MRLAICHTLTYRFADPVKSALQILRLHPRSFESQMIAAWSVDVDMDCRLRATDDAYCNATHILQADGPIENFTILAKGETQIFDAAGVTRGVIERFPPMLYLRDTPATETNPDLRGFARDAVAQATDQLDRLHLLMRAINDSVAFAPAYRKAEAALTTFAGKTGNSFELAQLFCACARTLNAPSRCVSGYLYLSPDHENGPYADFHGWAESYVDGIGWIGFDPAFCICPHEGYARLACGLDELDVRPARSSFGRGNVPDEKSLVEIWPLTEDFSGVSQSQAFS